MPTSAQLQPQEFMVYRFLPVIRARLARVLVEEYKMTQVEAAKHLNLTQAAVSHYMTHSRGADTEVVRLFPEIEEYVAWVAKAIAEGAPKAQQVSMLSTVSKLVMATERFCQYHSKEADLGGCKICFEPPAVEPKKA